MAVGKLIRVRPYHAGGPLAPQVWHDRSDCEQGRWIPSSALRPGTGGRERCSECAALDAAGPVDPRAVAPPLADRTIHTDRPVVAKGDRRTGRDRRRPRLGTVLGVVASAGLLAVVALWQTGSLSTGRNGLAARVISATSTTSTTKRIPPALGAAAKSPGPPAAAIPAPVATAAPAPAPAAPATQGKGTFYVGSDGYTHGTEDDGEVCSDNPDDPQWPCSYRVPGSDGIGAPLPDGAPSAAAPNPAGPAGGGSMTAQPGTGKDPTGAVTARTQRQAARQAARANRQR